MSIIARKEGRDDVFPGVEYGLIQGEAASSSAANHWTWWKYMLRALAVVGVVAVTSTIFLVSGRVEPVPMNDCGNSSAMAISRGCKMEPLIYGWIPPQCHYEELTAQYPVFHDRPWYRDANLTQQLSVEQLERGEFSDIYTQRFHTEHCLFMWRKLGLAVNQRREWVDNKSLSFYHAKHCVDQLIMGFEGKGDSSNAQLGSYKCVSLSWA